MKQVNIYTDGACSGNQNENNLGGWGAILQFGPYEKELWGGEHNTSNNRMELTALIKALSALKEGGLRLRIFSDSSYLVNCFKNKWYIKWQQNDWKNSRKKPVENRDLWERLLELLSPHEHSFFFIKGHISKPTQADFERFCAHLAKGGGAFCRTAEEADTGKGKKGDRGGDKKTAPCEDEKIGSGAESFTFEDFCKLVEYNNRCDALANIYIDEHRSEQASSV